MKKKYIKNPVQIETIQLKEDNIIEVFDFLDDFIKEYGVDSND